MDITLIDCIVSSLVHNDASKIMLIPAPWDQRSLASDFERGETLVAGPHSKGKKNSGGR